MGWTPKKITELLLEAGGIARRVQEDLRFEVKPDLSLVTAADKEIETLFERELERPSDGVYLIGEETIDGKGENYIEAALANEAYVVDPIDGTAPFAHHMPNWGVSVGRMKHGRLTDGAVYLPDFGEMVLSDGNAVLQGVQRGSSWEWTTLDVPRRGANPYGLLAITQSLAKRGKVLLPNPVMVLGVAVVPMVGLLQGRFQGYLGSVKLWDVAGALPLLLRMGFAISVMAGGERREVTDRVDDTVYDLAPSSLKRWALKSDLLICHPEDEDRFRAGFQDGDSGGD